MPIIRYSAAEMFGIPFDSPKQMEPDLKKYMKLISAYDIKGTEVEANPTDITPYYWINPNFRYFLSGSEEGEEATLDLMPNVDDAMTLDPLTGEEDTIRTIHIPTEQPAVTVIGSSPRFVGMVCLHEFITYER